MEAKRNNSMQYRTGYGSRYKNATEGGPSRISSMNRTTLNTLIKDEEHDESSKKIFGNDKFEQEEDLDSSVDNSNIPVVLPLIGCKQNFIINYNEHMAIIHQLVQHYFIFLF